MTWSAASVIQRLELMSAAGPQNLKSGNVPSAWFNSSRSAAGLVYTSGNFLPSAGYIGRGVTAQSTLVTMLYHQNRFAQVNAESRSRPASQTFLASTKRFDCRHNHTSPSSRKYQPLPTMPCSDGSLPVKNVDCAEQVTAGVTVVSGRNAPCFAKSFKCGVASPSRCSASPTTSITSVERTLLVPC